MDRSPAAEPEQAGVGTGPFRGGVAIVAGFGLVAVVLAFRFAPAISLAAVLGVDAHWTRFLWGVGGLEVR